MAIGSPRFAWKMAVKMMCLYVLLLPLSKDVMWHQLVSLFVRRITLKLPIFTKFG